MKVFLNCEDYLAEQQQVSFTLASLFSAVSKNPQEGNQSDVNFLVGPQKHVIPAA